MLDMSYTFTFAIFGDENPNTAACQGKLKCISPREPIEALIIKIAEDIEAGQSTDFCPCPN